MSDLKPITLPETMLIHTAAIAAAYLGCRSLAVDEIPDVVRKIYDALSKSEAHEEAVVKAQKKPVVPIKKSVFPDYIICLEDGKQFKTLKRHLQSTYNMSVEEYRAKWDLPLNYPMVAQNYAATRSRIAKKARLGKKG